MSSKSEIDDFKVIHGIGASVEDRLHKAGIMTYAQLAAKTPQEIADLLNGMVGFTPERIADQDWTGEAQQNALKAETSNVSDDHSSLQNHQHYEVFNLELLLDEQNTVRRTSVMHVQGKKKDHWAGWEENRLLDFFIDQATINIPNMRKEILSEEEIPANMSETISEPAQLAQENVGANLDTPTPASNITNQIHIAELEPRYADSSGVLRKSIQENIPFNVRITLDLSDTNLPTDAPINYLATIYAKKVGTGVRQTLGTSQGNFMTADQVIIDIGVKPLTRGSYRMDAVLTLSLSETESTPKTIPGAVSEGTVIHIY